MAPSSRRVVITGLGVLSPIGLEPDAFWQSLCQGRSGVHAISTFDASGLPVRFAGELPAAFDARNYLDKSQRKSLRMMSRTIQLAVCAAQKALEDGQVDKGKLDPTRFGVEFGSGMIASELPELAEAARITTSPDRPGKVDMDKWGKEGMQAIQPLFMLKYLPNMLACHVSMIHDAQGPNNSITETDVASTLALGEALRILQRDQADFFLVGGADSKINALSMVRQCLFEKLSANNAAPEKASRPFDQGHDGMVVGEGATVLTVETLEHARKRGARIYAELVGFGAAFDHGRDGRGLARAVRAALGEAGTAPEEVDHINAHGLSIPEADVWEARGLAEVFGDGGSAAPVFAPKSYFGNLAAGGGLTELAGSILALHHGATPATLNHDKTDPQCPVRVLSGAPREVARRHVVKVSFTQMGQCAAVVLRRWEG